MLRAAPRTAGGHRTEPSQSWASARPPALRGDHRGATHLGTELPTHAPTQTPILSLLSIYVTTHPSRPRFPLASYPHCRPSIC